VTDNTSHKTKPTRKLSAENVLGLRLRVNEIFLSIQGETSKSGLPTVFVRLTGCPLRCAYCDTAYAFHEGKTLSIASIMDNLRRYKTRHVTVTGGEPLAQKPCQQFLKLLCDEGFDVSLETSGAISLSDIDPRVKTIMDIKTPASGESHRNMLENLGHLDETDEIKFVICNRDDYLWAKSLLTERNLNERLGVLFSPSHDELDASLLADWILEDMLPVRLQIQLHKYLWGNVPGK
jgi:7-carboxy-7-deazaguanine synthase